MRKIKLTAQDKKKLVSQFSKHLDDLVSGDSEVTFKFDMGSEEGGCTIIYEPLAWVKEQMLLREFNTEVAWHCAVVRDSKFQYRVLDVQVYPQEVSAATVSMNTEDYAKWIMDNYDEEWSKHLFMQCHSHVNMSTGPSVTDLDHQKQILDQLEEDNFYIFAIKNKKGDEWYKVYDYKEGVVFSDNEVTVCVNGLDDFLDDAREMVREPVKSIGIVQDVGAHIPTPYSSDFDEEINPYTYYKNRLNGGMLR